MPTFRLSYSPSPQSPAPSPRLGITLVEILISMFVLLFGLMGVAAIFPVASHYVQDGDKKDRSSGLAQIAFAEIKARGMLKPETWAIPYSPTYAVPFMQLGAFTLAGNQGHAFILDPLGTAGANSVIPAITGYDYCPMNALSSNSPWFSPPSPRKGLTGNSWPIRRLTIDVDSAPLSAVMIKRESAETMFRLRDDLAIEQPEAGDRPSIQRFATGTTGQLLARQYQGDYSWMATVVPVGPIARDALQSKEKHFDEYYEVSAVVFHKRDTVPSVTTPGSPGSERMVEAEFLGNGELAIYDIDEGPETNDADTVETALDGIKPSSWIAVIGVHQTVPELCLMKWYKLLALDDESASVTVHLPNGNTRAEQARIAMVQGPDWPESRGAMGKQRSYWDLRVAILPGVVDVYTRTMVLD